MKNIVLPLVILLFALQLFSQAPTKQKFSKDHYLKKSNVEKIEAWVLLGGGATSVIIGVLIPEGEPVNGGYIFGPTYANDNVKGTFGGLGMIAVLTSIKFFIGSHRNKKKANAMTININNQRIFFPQQTGFVFKTQPSLILKIRF